MQGPSYTITLLDLCVYVLTLVGDGQAQPPLTNIRIVSNIGATKK